MSTDTQILCRAVFPVSHQGPGTRPGFHPLATRAGAFTHSLAEKDDLVTIKTQEEALLKKAGLVLNAGYEY